MPLCGKIVRRGDCTVMRQSGLHKRIAADGKMDVSVVDGVMTVAFTRSGDTLPVVVYTLTPGEEVFALQEIRD